MRGQDNNETQEVGDWTETGTAGKGSGGYFGNKLASRSRDDLNLVDGHGDEGVGGGGGRGVWRVCAVILTYFCPDVTIPHPSSA